MGDQNQIIYLKKHLPTVNGPVLEVGSKDYGSTSSFRDIYTHHDYVGVDMQSGRGVDTVVDLTSGIGPLQSAHFALVICCSVLEHVRRPWIFAEHITQLTKVGGSLYMSVPWVWRYHPYPDDYYRFSWRGIRELFPAFGWTQMEYSTNVEGEFIPITDQSSRADNRMAIHRRIQLFDSKRRKYLPYLMINMLGKKSI
jgi:hypothetical protein